MLTLRRDFLKKTVLALGTAVGMGGVAASSNPAASAPKPLPPPVDFSWPRINVMDFGAVGNAVHNDSENILDAIDSAPKRGGAIIEFPQPPVAYLIETPVRIRTRALTLLGSGKLGENDSSPYAGSVVLCETPGVAAFNFDKGGLEHQSSVIRGLGLHTSDKTVKLLRFWNQNRWRVEHCGFRGGDVALSIERGEDNSWNVIDDCSFRLHNIGVFDQGYGTEYRGGKWLGCNWAVHLDYISQHCRIRDLMIDGPTGGIKILGGNHSIFGCKFEGSTPGILVDGDGSGVSGRGNFIGWNSHTGKAKQRGRAIDVLDGARDTILERQSYVWIGKTITDAGQNTKVLPV